MPNSMTIELVTESERKKRPSKFGSFKEKNQAQVVVSLPVSALLVIAIKKILYLISA